LQPNKTQSSTGHTQSTTTTTASPLTANWQQPKQPNNEGKRRKSLLKFLVHVNDEALIFGRGKNFVAFFDELENIEK